MEDINVKEKDFEDFDLSSLDEMMAEFGESQQEQEQEEQEDIALSQEEEEQEEFNEESEEDSNEKKQEEPSSHETKDSPLTPYAKMLVEEGLLPNIDLEKFDGSAESLLEAQRQYDLERFESFKESTLDPRVKWLQDNLEQGVPLVKLLELDEQKFTLENITEETLSESEDVQKNILKNYYKETTNFGDDKINKIIERLETLGELETESKSSLEELKGILQQKEQAQIEQAKQERLNAQEQQKKALEDFQKTLDKTQEIIPGIKVSDLLKDRIKQTLTTPVAIDQQTGMPLNKIAKARAENPLDFEIKLAYLFEVTKGFTDWNALGSSGKRKALEEFEKSASSIDFNKGQYKSANTSKQTNSYLEEMEKISRNF